MVNTYAHLIRMNNELNSMIIHCYEHSLLRCSYMALGPTGFLPLFLRQAWSSLHPECELIFQLQEEERSCLQHIAEQANDSSDGPCLWT